MASNAREKYDTDVFRLFVKFGVIDDKFSLRLKLKLEAGDVVRDDNDKFVSKSIASRNIVESLIQLP